MCPPSSLSSPTFQNVALTRAPLLDHRVYDTPPPESILSLAVLSFQSLLSFPAPPPPPPPASTLKAFVFGSAPLEAAHQDFHFQPDIKFIACWPLRSNACCMLGLFFVGHRVIQAHSSLHACMHTHAADTVYCSAPPLI